jgi:dihydroorotase
MSMFDLLVRDGRIVGENGVKEQSVAIAGGRVAALIVDGELPPARETIDAKGKLVLPGLVDSHVHFRDPGLTHKEDFETGTLAAAAGGVTTVMVMPTDNPFTLTPADFSAKIGLAEIGGFISRQRTDRVRRGWRRPGDSGVLLRPSGAI